MAGGEQLHEDGAVGVRRAKRWLDATMRVSVEWIIPDDRPKLVFTWVTGNEYTFDLGGTMHGGQFQGKTFYAEVKNYKNAGDQGPLYDEYLAKCYRAYGLSPNYCDHFFWITWAPFRATDWDKQLKTESVSAAVALHATKALEDADAGPDARLCQEVAERLWIIVLSRKQEALTITPAERALIISGRAATT